MGYDTVHPGMRVRNFCRNIVFISAQEQNKTCFKGFALGKFTSGSKVNELRNLDALVYKIRCESEDRVKKVVLRLGGGEELDCT
jgi:hypothetical protein